MSKATTLVRTDLTDQEWADFRKLAIDLRGTTSGTAGDALRSYTRAKRLQLARRSQRALLKGDKP